MFSKWIENELSEFLKGTQERLRLGPGEEKPRLSDADASVVEAKRTHLVDQLTYRRRLSLGLILTIVVLYLIVFGVLLAFIIDRWESRTVVPLIVGQSGSLIAIVWALQRFWRDAISAEMLLAFLPGVPPERAIEIVSEWYHAKKTSRRRGRR